MGPEAGARGGQVVAAGTVQDLAQNPDSRIGPFLCGREQVRVHRPAPEKTQMVLPKGRSGW